MFETLFDNAGDIPIEIQPSKEGHLFEVSVLNLTDRVLGDPD